MEADEFIRDFYYEKLDFCGCGNPEDTLKLIRDVLNEIKEHWLLVKASARYPEGEYDRFQNKLHETFNFADFKKDGYIMTDTQNGVVQFVMYLLDSKDVLEHGGSIGGAWLTNYGEELLEHLNACDLEDVLK